MFLPIPMLETFGSIAQNMNISKEKVIQYDYGKEFEGNEKRFPLMASHLQFNVNKFGDTVKGDNVYLVYGSRPFLPTGLDLDNTYTNTLMNLDKGVLSEADKFTMEMKERFVMQVQSDQERANELRTIFTFNNPEDKNLICDTTASYKIYADQLKKSYLSETEIEIDNSFFAIDGALIGKSVSSDGRTLLAHEIEENKIYRVIRVYENVTEEELYNDVKDCSDKLNLIIKDIVYFNEKNGENKFFLEPSNEIIFSINKILKR
ncbi:hypothetical protein PIROE2DRAFT_15447 [Piromyces sp. E2]|nr:hypothetical protein PIROE2DRAFT_15447 [Piromyces sp. E2]|eukprot:OUM59117.1 hypothetical protein PIROE2DRAFT_15447 [Piromyces sp. E2]